ncbi:MAG: 2-amino-4-hydroxy-6-hydroxymethyldihydropteridine diphosphokinase [Chromatocurvus sp.]
MVNVFLGLGSNMHRERYIGVGLDALAEMFGALHTSSLYDGDAIGFAGDPFLNLVVRIETGLPVGALARQLRQLEFAHGRPVNASRNSPRQLDIDILTYDDRVGVVDGVVLPRPEILTNAFVLRPLAELAPRERHPVVGETYAALWDAYDQAAQALRPVAFAWRGRALPVG